MIATVEGVVGMKAGERRGRARRSRCFSVKKLRRIVEEERAADPDLWVDIAAAAALRPRTRADCLDGPRPCPFMSCRYHLAIDVTRAGSLLVNFPGVDMEDLPATCALDLADEGGQTLEVVGSVLNIVRERVRQELSRVLWDLRDGLVGEEE